MEGKRKDSKYNNKNHERYFEKIMSSLKAEDSAVWMGNKL
jgi:hypothetical protein